MSEQEQEPVERPEDEGEAQLPEGEYWKVPADEEPGVVTPDPAALIAVLHEGDPIQCEEAIEQLAEIGEEALPLLQEALEGDNPDVRIDAAKAIALIKSNPPA